MDAFGEGVFSKWLAMKRRVEDATKVEGAPPQNLLTQRTPHTASSIVQTNYTTQAIKSVGGDVTGLQQYSLQSSYATMPSITTTSIKSQGGGLQAGAAPHGGILVQPHARHKVPGGGGTSPPSVSGGGGGAQQQFQRLKVEDALSYLDQVKHKFNSQPQVYNDFLDIMKEFKSQCIDTPGVITRVSNLFKGYPELISGFNTFLPPGYKIEVQANDTGYSLQVSVSMASPVGGGSSTTHHITDIPPLIHTTTQQTSVVVANQVPTKPPTISYGTTVNNSQGLVGTPGAMHLKSVSGQDRSHAHNSHSNLSGSGAGGLLNNAPAVGGMVSQVAVPQMGPQAPVTAIPPPVPQSTNHQTAAAASQPVEFNHAINYVNKIKNRFQSQPDKYKKFLEILHTYQKEQRTTKGIGGSAMGSGGKHLTEAEVYSQVARLFEHQEDLLTEFGQFLPDATSHNSALANLVSRGKSLGVSGADSGIKSGEPRKTAPKYSGSSSSYGVTKGSPPTGGVGGADRLKGADRNSKRGISEVYPGGSHHHSDRSNTHHQPPVKRHKYHSLNHSQFAYFESLKKTLKNSEAYWNILRCIRLYNEDLVTKHDLLALVSPILARVPDMLRWLKEFLNADLPIPMASPMEEGVGQAASCSSSSSGSSSVTGAAGAALHASAPPTVGHSDGLDLTTCKRIGASYCSLPKNHAHPRCSGRTALCRQVLNDTWVSFPSWSEEATFITSKKNHYEEVIYRCEDERFELDLVLEVNATTIRVLESVQKKMSRMTAEDMAKFRLDDCLGGSSPTIHIRAIKRIYGDKAADIVEGLKRNPSVAVPIVLRRLKAKELEWRQAQKGFNKIWREQNEKCYLKSLDHQGINFKQNDLKALRSKSLYAEIEAAAYEKNENQEREGEKLSVPHLVLPYKDRSVLDDAANLLIHHVKRQTGIHKQDKQRIKQLIRQFIPDLFHHPRQELSDDERDEDEKMDLDLNVKETNGPINENSIPEVEPKLEPTEGESEQKIPPHAISSYPDEVYTLFFGNSNWYLFMRLHQILCDRLAKMSEKSAKIAEEEGFNRQNRKESTAVALRLKPNEHVPDCYAAMLEMVKSVLDCSMETTTYEDTLRNMFGIHAYIGFTLDRIVSYAVRQLQQLVSEDSCIECWEMHLKERVRGGSGGPCKTAIERQTQETNYQKAALTSLAEANSSSESCYKMFIYKRECKLTIEMLDIEEEPEDSKNTNSKWSPYDNAIKHENTDDRERWVKASFLRRNLRKRVPERQLDTKSPTELNVNEANSLDGPKKDSNEDVHCCIKTHNDSKVVLVNKEIWLLRNKALLRAKQSHPALSRRLHRRFARWHERWSSEHVTEEAREATARWMMGLIPDCVPHKTHLSTEDPTDRSPYRPYIRYKVSYPLPT